MRPQKARRGSDDLRLTHSTAGRSIASVVAAAADPCYADTGDEHLEVPTEMVQRAASAWTGQPVSSASVEEMTEVDQWTVQTRLAI